MSELIDRQALKAAHGLGTDCADCKQNARSCQYDRDFSRMDFCEWIDDAPTVEPAPRWHRVEDGLPDKVGSYLVYAPTYRGGSSSEKECKAGVMFARWLKGGHWSIEVGYYKRPGCVTHWMPIEPPKEDA